MSQPPFLLFLNFAMKKTLFAILICLPVLISAQDGYEIKIQFKPFANQTVYLGHYAGKQFPIVDSVKLNAKAEGVLKGSQKLGGGIYVLAYPTRDRFIEMLIDQDQHFSVFADTSNLGSRYFTGSDDNEQFLRYQSHVDSLGRRLSELEDMRPTSAALGDSAFIDTEIKGTRKAISDLRHDITSERPQSILAMLMRLMEEPQVPPASAHPGGSYDSAYAYRYFKNHYWDGLYFFDDRMVRTPASLFDSRLDKYMNTLFYPDADSVIRELDYMLGYATPSKEMTKYLLVKFVTRYLNQQFMWEDKVFVHLFQKYFANKNYDWLTEEGKKMITNRAYSLMSNIMGNPAEDIALPDQKGNLRLLYADTARFTLVTFWDPTCGHCKETLPQIDSMYRKSWKNIGLRIFAVAKETEGKKEDWLKFISDYKLDDWTHVYYSKAEEKLRVDNNIPGYVQLYDAQTVPALFLLDREKRIIAKKLTWEQTDEILKLKLQKQ
jgi:thiol-disulfide isomerase/thioredoxin